MIDKPEWTATRLNALPVDTVVGFSDVYSGAPRRTTRYPDGFDLTLWREGFPGAAVMEAAEPGSIRVVSVPIDALLSEGVAATANPPVADGHIRAAIAHVTGEAP